MVTQQPPLTDFQSLQWQLEEQVNPGAPVKVLIGVDRELSDEALGLFQAELSKGGLKLLSPVTFGSTPEWPNALRLHFRRPRRPEGIAFLPLAAVMTLAIGAVGITGILGWRVAEAVKSIGNSIAKSLVPLGIIASVFFVTSAIVKKPVPT